MFRTIPRYEEAGLGLPYSVILIDSAEEEIDDVTGQPVGVIVPDTEKLVAAVAIARALDPARLDGREVRFVRHVLGMTSTAFAEALNMSKETFSRWENNRQELGEWADKQVRLFAILKLGPHVPCLEINADDVIGMRVSHREPDQWPHMEFRRSLVATGQCAGMEEWDTCELLAA